MRIQKIVMGIAWVGLGFTWAMGIAWAAESTLTGSSAVSSSAANPILEEPLVGVAQAREWQHAGDIALEQGQLEVAHLYYEKVLKIYPRTTHAAYAKEKLAALQEELRKPAESPGKDEWPPSDKEVKDTFTW